MSKRATANKSDPAAAPSDTTLARDLLHVAMQMMRSIAKEMRRSPKALAPAQMASLMRLSSGPAATSELARHLAVSVPTVSKSIDVLVDRGWVERWIDPSNRRQTIVRLTTEGRGVATEMKRQSRRHVAGLLASLTPAQRSQLMTTLDVLKGVLPPLP
jgi:DNA-binding MarR family transcriptional regulator